MYINTWQLWIGLLFFIILSAIIIAYELYQWKRQVRLTRRAWDDLESQNIEAFKMLNPLPKGWAIEYNEDMRAYFPIYDGKTPGDGSRNYIDAYYVMSEYIKRDQKLN